MQVPTVEWVRLLSVAILMPMFVLTACADDKSSERQSARSATPTSEVTASTRPMSGRVPISDAGNEVYYRCSGTGKPVILLEAGDDSGGTEAYGSAIIDPLASHTTTCTYDRPGTGRSDPSRGRRRTLADYRADLSGFLHGAHLRPPYLLVGQSGGGNLLISYAAAHPRDVAGLDLIETYHDDPARLEEEFGPFDPATATGEKFDTVADMRALDNLGLPLGRFPVLVMTATNADPGNKANQAYWLRISPNSRQAVIAGSHDLHVDNPGRVTREIIRTLRDIRMAT